MNAGPGTLFQRRLTYLRAIKSDPDLHFSDIARLRGYAFEHSCRNDDIAVMIEALISIYTNLAILERLTS